jgi:hypothetical protein
MKKSTIIEYLGLTIDTVNMLIAIPEKKPTKKDKMAFL